MNKRMKKIFASLVVIAFTCNVKADNDYLQYEYDAAGNRIGRTIVQSQPNQAPKRNLLTADITVFPTITSDNVTISIALDAEKHPMRFTLRSVQGSVLNTKDIISQQTVVPMGQYAAGVYLLTIESESIIESYKIIKK